MSVEARGIRFSYQPERTGLRGVDLLAADSEVKFVLGANGSGKTTLLQILIGLLAPQEGRVSVDGRPIDRLSPRARARRIALVPQSHPPRPGFTVSETVVMGRAARLGAFSTPRAAEWSAADAALDALGIASLADRSHAKLSGGERQLAMIARGLAQGANTLALDEPDAHLDPAYQQRVLSALGRLSERGMALLLTSHQPNNALVYAHSVVFLAEGVAAPQLAPREALTEERLEAAYGVSFDLIESPAGARALLPRRDGR